MKHHSTGALTLEQKNQQNALYNENHEYDYVFIGTGVSALTCAALLANAGKRVCLLEAHDRPGGYAHSFSMAGYWFCAEIHYIWGCAPGGRVYEFLKKIGLENEITFELYNPTGYDHMVMPDNKRVPIPYGFDKLAQQIELAYPGQQEPVRKFTSILEKIRSELRALPERKIKLLDIATQWYKGLTLLRYLKCTLQDVFDECGLSREAQAVLIANMGDMMAPPNELSIFAYAGLFGGYNTGAYYPTQHFKGVIDRYAKYITEHTGCHIYYETQVKRITVDNGQVVNVQCVDGKVFKAKQYICNADPQYTANTMIGREHFPKSFSKKLNYTYSPAGIMVYLGLKPGVDLHEFGFGKWNIWHLTQWDMNKMWHEQLHNHDFTNPWFFISTPSLHTEDPSNTPAGCQNMEIATLASYEYFQNSKEKSYADYNREKMKLADRLLDLVEKYHVPNLRNMIQVKVVGTSTTNEDFCLAPFGTAYGSHLNPQQIGLNRLKSQTPFPNLFWCNASSGFAGFHGTTGTGISLYMDLTGDRFFNSKKTPTDNELINRINYAVTNNKKLINVNL